MNTSESIKEIAAALVEAQKEIRAAIKDSTNPHFRSKYADLSSVVDAVKGPLLKNGIAYLQGVHDAEGGVAVETMLIHRSGEWISSTLRVPASKQDAQGYGSAITYGRRYGLQSMCGVPAEDDDGNAASASVKAQEVNSEELMEVLGTLSAAAHKGTAAFRKAWTDIPQKKRALVDAKSMAALKKVCDEADMELATQA